MKSIIFVAVLVFSTASISSERLIIDKSEALELCATIETNWEESERLTEKRRQAINFIKDSSKGDNKILFIEKGSIHYNSYSYRAFLLEKEQFSFYYYDLKKKSYTKRILSYEEEPSAKFLTTLFSQRQIEEVVLSFDNMPKDLVGSCHNMSFQNGNIDSTFYYLNSTLDNEKNKASNLLELSVDSVTLDLLNYLVFFKIDE